MAEGWTARLVLLLGLWVERWGPLGMALGDEGGRIRQCACVLWSESVFFGYSSIQGGGFDKITAKKHTAIV